MEKIDLIGYISIGIIVAFFAFICIAINYPEWFHKDNSLQPTKKRKRIKLVKSKILLSDLLFAVEKIAIANGETYFSASASMNPAYQMELKAYISGFDLVVGHTIKEVCDKLLASKCLVKKEVEGKVVAQMETPKPVEPEVVKKVKPIVYEEVVIQ